jgi:NADP-dependent 3-hydroxy acid dehydrogenase YdfG
VGAERLAALVDTRLAGVDRLVQCIGTFSSTPLGATTPEELDRLYRVNTRALLPRLCERQVQIAFVNSSVAMKARRGVGPYAASKHGLRALADALRDEVKALGVRVLSIYLGRTATPIQEEVHRLEGATYRPELLLQPRDMAAAILDALGLPRSAEITDLHSRPMRNG